MELNCLGSFSSLANIKEEKRQRIAIFRARKKAKERVSLGGVSPLNRHQLLPLMWLS
jgi:hypothetical protein